MTSIVEQARMQSRDRTSVPEMEPGQFGAVASNDSWVRPPPGYDRIKAEATKEVALVGLPWGVEQDLSDQALTSESGATPNDLN
jgi:hypothetical protein